MDEIVRRSEEAWERGATEVCLQGGIHPEYTGATYLSVCRAIKQALPDMHVHAFSPLEVWQGAKTLGRSLPDFLAELRDAGLGSLPGTAAEILDDEVRAIICPDKVKTAEWLQVMEAAHGVGLRSTVTIMYGHVERYEHWARHLLRVRALQQQTGGFTEFVPLPFVPMETPISLKGRSRLGPDLSRGDADARGRAPRVASGDPEHPGVVGQARAGGRRRLPQRRLQRHGRHADERKHLARRRRQLRPGDAAGEHGSADPLARPHAAPAHDPLPRPAGDRASPPRSAPRR